MPPWRAAIIREGGWVLHSLWALLKATGAEARQRPWLATGLVALAAGAALAAGTWDSAVHAWARDGLRPDDPVVQTARAVRTFGAFTDVLTWSAILLVLGRMLGRERWRRLGIACFLAASLSGLAANLVRPTLGRARPDTDAGVWALRGPVLNARWQSMPSGHSATSFGGGAVILALGSPFGIVTAAEGLLVATSSVRLDRHWLSDAAGGIGLGLATAVLVALAFRRLERDGGWPAGP